MPLRSGIMKRIAGWVLVLLLLTGAGSIRAGDPGDEPDELELEFELLQHEETVVTATKQEQTVAEAPSIITVITREQIIQRNHRSVAEAVASVPGMFVNYDYVFHDVGVRGISGELRGASRLIKVMINGQPVSFRSETTNFLGPELVPIEAVERIEVIRGPASALYGANAFLGVVNIMTRSGEDARGATVSLTGSLFKESYGGAGLGLAAGGRIGALDLFVSVAHAREERSGQTIKCTAAVEGEEPCGYVTAVTERLMQRSSFDDIGQPASVLATAGAELGALFGLEDVNLGRLDVTGNLQFLDYRGSFSDWGSLNYGYLVDAEGNSVGRIEGSGNRVALYNGVLHGRYKLGLLDELLGIELGAAYAQGGSSDAERLVEVSGPVNRSGYGFDGVDLSLELSLRPLRIGKGDAGGPAGLVSELEFQAGVDCTRDDISYVPWGEATSLRFTRSTLYNIGAWGQAVGTFIDGRLRLVAGVRYDRHRGASLGDEAREALEPEERERLCGNRVCYDQMSVRAGATYLVIEDAVSLGEDRGSLLEAVFVKALYGTAFKAPSPVFLYNQGFLGERPLNPNPALLPQEIGSLELQLGSSMIGKKLNVTLTFFYNELTNKAEFARHGLAVVARNGSPVESRGIEGQLQMRWMPFELYGNLAYQSSRRKLGDNLDRRIADTFGYPGLMMAAGASWHIDALRLVFNIELQYVGERVGHFFNRSDRIEDRYTLEPYFLLHLNLVTREWKPLGDKETRLALSLRNLLDARYDFPGFQPYYRYDVPGLPRILLLSLSQDF